MTMFHKPIKRTFHRRAINGVVRCDNRVWVVSANGIPFNGDVTMYINAFAPAAWVKGDRTKRLVLAAENAG